MTVIQRWIQAGECLALVAVIVAAFAFGHHTASVAADRDKAQAVAKQQAADIAEFARQAKQTQDNAQAGAAQGEATAADHAAIKTQFQTITKTVVKYVATHPDNPACVLGDDGLRAWREANAGSVEPGGAGEH